MKIKSRLIALSLFLAAGIKLEAQCWKTVDAGGLYNLAIKQDGTNSIDTINRIL
jgi:hypothetical protein